MKAFWIFGSFAVIAVILIPIIGNERGDRRSQEQSHIVNLLSCVSLYAKKNGGFPKTIQEALDFSKLDDEEIVDFTKDPNFRYLYPESQPEETDPYTMLIEFRTKDGTYRGYFGRFAQFKELPSS